MKKIIWVLAVSLATACHQAKKGDTTTSIETVGVDSLHFSTQLDSQRVALYEIVNDNMKVQLTNFGARIVSLVVKDKQDSFVDVVLGYDTAEEFIQNSRNFYGAIVGRYGNRIGKASFVLNNTTYNLEKNDNNNTLHGGFNGVYNKVWKVDQASSTSITFSYYSPDGEAGYPGNVLMKVTYSLNDKGGLEITYDAETDKETVLNLTNHAYFNLNGAGDSTILDHHLWIDADKITEVDAELIPTGKGIDVTNTPFDFRVSKEIGKDIGQDHPQIAFGKGYDHNFELNKKENFAEVAKLYAPRTGIEMTILTTEPGLQFYSGNFMSENDPKGKKGQTYPYRSALCLETQHFPDAPNHPNFASTVLKPGEKYASKTEYRFAVK